MEEKLSFEKSMKELETILHSIDSSEIGLDEQIKLYERGMKLHSFCQNYLKKARLKVEKLIEAENGQKQTEELVV